MVDKIKKQNYVHLLILQNIHKKGSNKYKYKFHMTYWPCALLLKSTLYMNMNNFHLINRMYM